MLTFYLSLVEDENDKRLIEELYKSNRQTMYYIAKSCLHNSHDAEDAIHEAFLRAIENIEKLYSIPANKRASYLNVIVRNVSYGIYKRKNSSDLTADDEDIISNDISPEEEALSNIEYENLVQLIKGLPDGQKDVMYLKYCLGFTTEEIASALSISSNAVNNRLFKAKNNLRKQFENNGN